jgi:hypothetical protein
MKKATRANITMNKELNIEEAPLHYLVFEEQLALSPFGDDPGPQHPTK